MSEYVHVRITYRAPYSLGNARLILEAIARGVEANWNERYYDAWSNPSPSIPPRPETWLWELERSGLSEASECVAPRGLLEGDPVVSIGYGEPFSFSFSPNSQRFVEAWIERSHYGAIRIYVHATRHFLGEERSERAIAAHPPPPERLEEGWELAEAEMDAWQEWHSSLPHDTLGPDNAWHLLHIVGHLTTALPVASVDIHPALIWNALDSAHQINPD